MVGGGPQPGVAQAERAEYGLRHVRAGAQHGQLDEADVALLPIGGLDRQPGLAGAARSVERDQAGLAEQLADPAQFVLPPDEAAELAG